VTAFGLAGLLDELAWRGLLQDTTPGLAARLASGRPISGYNGFDPSGPSLHVGHLVPVFGLLHFQRHGGRPIAVVGGGTGMVGDPSGKSAERNLLDRETIAANVAGIRGQLERFLDFTPGAGGAVMANNLDWLSEVSMLDFLRDVGKHFTIPYMLAKDSVQKRLGGGLSYTEFSYMLLQAADFLHLYRTLGVEMQMGGADQWGNITAGLELIRRVEGAAEGAEPAHGLSYPLLTDEGGGKFGKTAEGTSVWLDAGRTSPFAFYQYWFNAPDVDVGAFLRRFTLLPRGEIEALETDHAAAPERRIAQRTLALDITARVHGPAEAETQRRAGEALFGDEALDDPEILASLYGNVDSFEFEPADLDSAVGDLCITSHTFGSRSDVRRAIGQGSLRINDMVVTSFEQPVPDPIGGRYLVIRTGKRRRRIGRLRT
jgi:tyrosyl-tRNA synthetase